MKRLLLSVIVTLTFISSGLSQSNTAQNQMLRTNFAAVKSAIELQNFKYVPETVYNNANREVLDANAKNYFLIDDLANIKLPSLSADNNNLIVKDGIVSDFKVTSSDKTKRLTNNFIVTYDDEVYNCNISVASNSKAFLVITSKSGDQWSFVGKISKK